MGRVRTHIDVEGRRLWTLFDPGARNTYIVREMVGPLPHWTLPNPQPAGIGGDRHVVTSECTLLARVEGQPVSVKARVVDEIGRDEEGRRIEVLFGALAMREWGINVDTKNERLDLTHYPREFVEF